jgi:hypothetical protein
MLLESIHKGYILPLNNSHVEARKNGHFLLTPEINIPLNTYTGLTQLIKQTINNENSTPPYIYCIIFS